MIAATDDGIYMDTNRSWSIDDKRLNFQFGCEIAWEIKDGQLGQMLRNPTYTGIGPRFWASMDMVGGPDEWVFWGTANCGKGQPIQVGHTGHPAVPGPVRRTCGWGSADGWDHSTDPVAQVGSTTCDRVLELVGDRADALVTCGQGTNALTRFANSRIHQNMASDEGHVRLRVVVDDGRIAQATTTRLDPDGLERLVEGTIAAARLCPADPSYPGTGRAPARWSRSTTSTRPPRRRRRMPEPRWWPTSWAPARTSSRPATAPPTRTCTCCAPPPGSATPADRRWPRSTPSTGRRPSTDRPPMATARSPPSGSPTSTGGEWGSWPPPRPPAGPTRSSSTPGSYEVVLEPRAVAAMLLFPAWLGFNGKAHAEGTSFAHLGEQQFDDRISIWDDGTDPRALGRPYDAEGTPKRRVDLVTERCHRGARPRPSLGRAGRGREHGQLDRAGVLRRLSPPTSSSGAATRASSSSSPASSAGCS